MPAIPFFDARAGYEELAGQLDAAALRVLRSGAYILGEEVAEFERAFAAYCGAEHCAGVGNGLDALTLILRALDVDPGDEVVVPAHTFIATWLAVSAVGATPVPVEPDPVTYNVTAEAVERALGPDTRAVICVHLHGRLVDTEALGSSAARAASRSSRTPPRHTAPRVRRAVPAHWRTPPPSRSIRPRTSAPTATAAR